jgi:hypothetical protein
VLRAALLALGPAALAVAATPAQAVTTDFFYTGKEQTFTVPAGVFSLHALAVGGSGGPGASAGGVGGQVSGDIEVTPGETLYVEVGGNGGNAEGGFDGGGAAGTPGAGAGGGASDVRTAPLGAGLKSEDRLIVAAGGGGGGGPGEGIPGSGGIAGASTGEQGGSNEIVEEGGGGGTLFEGGAGGGGTGGAGEKGSRGQGGIGGLGGTAGGGGGGGYFGGGGGGGGLSIGGAGGGGGSSLVPTGGSFTLPASGTPTQVDFSYTPPEGFASTGGEQTFTVPAGVTTVHVVAVGGRGGSAAATGGAPAVVSANLAVTPGQTLFLEVGGNGNAKGVGGFNGGGVAGAEAGGGGGATDVRTATHTVSLASGDRLLVAGGGGGGGGPGEGSAGAGGAAGSNGGSDESKAEEGGGAGTSTAGGAGGFGTEGFGENGSLGQGGRGGALGFTFGGGGGGGYFGGGGGGGGLSLSGGGGGGGSSLVPAGGSIELAGSGMQPQLQITYTPPSPPVPPVPPSAPPSSPASKTPVVVGLTESAKTWKAGSAPARLSAKRHVPVGTTFSFQLDETAAVTLTFTTGVSGRRVHGRCVAKSPHNSSKPRCRRTVTAGVLVLPAHAGLDKIRFAGRLPGGRKLAPGSYRLQLTAANAAGRTSAPQSLTFTIVK